MAFDLKDLEAIHRGERKAQPQKREGFTFSELEKIHQDVAVAGKPPDRDFGDIARDVGVTGLKGAVGLAESIIGLADIPTFGYAGKAAEKSGVKFKETGEILDSWMSPAQKTAQLKFQRADGLLGKTKAAIENPSVVAQTTGESIPLMLGGGGLARMLQGVLKMSPLVAASIGEGAISAGSTAEGIRQQTDTGTLDAKQVGLSSTSGAGTAMFGFLGAKAARKMGLADVDVLAAGGDVVEAATKKGIPRKAIEGAVAEGVLEEFPQSVQEQVLNNLALGRDPWQGVEDSAVLGTLAGMAMGGPAAALASPRSTHQPKPTMTDARREVKSKGGDALDQAAASAGVQSQEINTLGSEPEQEQPGFLQLGAPPTQRPALPEPNTIFAGGTIPQASPQGYDPRGSQDEGQRGTERMDSLAYDAQQVERQPIPQLEAPVEDVEAREIINLNRRINNLENFSKRRRMTEKMQRNLDRLKQRRSELEQTTPQEQAPQSASAQTDVWEKSENKTPRVSLQSKTVSELTAQRRNAQALTVTDPQAKMDGYVFVNGGRKNDKWQVIGPNGKPRPVSRTLLERFDRARSQGQTQPYIPAGQVTGQVTGQVPDMDEMVGEAARWRGAALNFADSLDNRGKMRVSKQTTKGDLDAYLMRRFGIDETTARDVSNELTRRNIQDDRSADPAEYAGEPWAQSQQPADLPSADTVTAQARPAERTEAQRANDERLRRERNKVDPEKDDIIRAISKLGGLDMEQARSEWGTTITDASKELRKRQVFGKPVLRRKNGRKLDDMVQSLRQYGYLQPDADGNYTINSLLEALDAAIRGKDVRSEQYQYDDNIYEDIPPQPDVDEFFAFDDSQLAEDGYNDLSDTDRALYEELAAQVDEEILERLAIQSEGLSDAEYYQKAIPILEEYVGQTQQPATREERTDTESPRQDGSQSGSQSDRGQVLTEQTEAGEQTKMFATPPTFGKRPQGQNATLDDMALYSEPLERAENARQGDMFDSAPNAEEQTTDAAGNDKKGQKTEYVDWFVNYTEREGTGRTTETMLFTTLKEARDFAKGKHGYILRSSDGGSTYNARENGSASVVEYFGGFEPSAQEALTIRNLGADPNAPQKPQTQEATNGLQEGRKEEVGDDTSRYSRKKSASLKKADIGEFETGKKVSFNFVHNTESATSIFGKPSRSSPYDRGFEPSGRYVTPVGSVPDQLTDNMISGTLTFNNPLVIPNTDNGKSWKKALSEAYGGKRGKKLSLEIIKDGYDGVVTVDETRSGQKYASEILDLTTFDEAKALYSRVTSAPRLKIDTKKISVKPTDVGTNEKMAFNNAKVETIETLEDAGYLTYDVLYELNSASPSNLNLYDVDYALEKFGDGRTFEEIYNEQLEFVEEDGLSDTQAREWEPSGSIEEWAKLAKGVTDDINEAGYVLRDGTLLDFSGKRIGGPGGERAEDHRQIHDIPFEGDLSGSDLMIAFQQEVGAVRIDSNAGLVDTESAPTPRQYRVILDILMQNDGGYVSAEDGSRRVEFETENPQKAVALLKRFYAGEDLGQGDIERAKFTRKSGEGSATLAEISTHIDALTGKWKNAPTIAVVQSETDLPAATQRDIESVNAQGQVRGVFHRGSIYLVADNLSTTAQAEEALFHEALGHYGMRRLFGPQFNQSMAKLYTALGKEAGIRRLAEQYGIDLKDYLDNAGHLSATQRERMLVDELVSHLLGDNVQPNLVQRVVGAIRNAIRRMGLAQLADFNNADLLRLVRLSREAVTKGKRGSVIVTAAPSVTDFNQPLRGMPENIVQMMMGSDLSRIDQTQTEPSKEDSFVYRRKDGEIGEGFTQWADDPDIIEHYGDTMWRVPVDELMSADDFIALAKPVIEEGYKNGRLSASAEEMIDEHGIDAVVADLNPDDIVDSAAAWDWDSPFSEYLYDELIEKENIKGIKTNNGAVVFDSDMAEKLDPSTQDIRYARSRPRGGVGPAPSIREKLSPKVKDATDYLRMKWQDKFTPVRLAQDELESLGWVKTEENDAYLAEERFHGKAATRLDNFHDDRIKPLTERMKELNLDTQDVEDYLYAKFAPERNAHVAKVNKKMPYAGSGMFATRAEKQRALDEGFNHLKDLRVAEDVLAELTPKMDALQQIEPMVREITQMQRDIIRNEGLEGEEIVDAWELSSQNYIPLKGGKQERPSVGQGFGVKGSGTKRALGRSTEAENILAHLFGQVGDTIVRAEKVKVSRAFLRMVEENPSDAWEIHETIPTRRTMAKNAELTAARKKLGELKRQLKVADAANKSAIYARIAELEQAIPQMPEMSVREIADFNFTQSENVVPITREDGSVVYVEIAEDAKFGGTTGSDLGRVMKNMTAGQHGKTLQVLGAFTRYLSKMSTMFNPEFVITNFERDLQTAMINLSGEQSAKMAKNVLKSVPSSIRGIHNALRGDKSHEMAKWYKRFREAGGGISFMDLRGVEHIQKDIETALKGDRNKARVAIRKLGDLIGDYNSMFENAARLSAFKVAVESGMSEAKAASIAKNLTVNFNRKGELGPAMNALYMFFNAGMQGSARIFGALKSKRTRQIVGTIMLAAWGLAEMNRYMAGDDEDDVNKWDKVNPYLKHTNIILMRPDGAPIKVKLPYGYNVFVAMGYAMSDIFHWMQGDGGKNPVEAGKDLTIAALNAFNPLGGDNGPLQMLSPTITDPLVDIAVNENFMGNPIIPEQPPWGPKKPESELYFRSVSPLSKSITQTVNRLTGGNKWEPGLVSVSPEVLDHIYDFIGGGALRSARDMVMLPAELSKEKPSIRRIPFLRQIFSEPDTRFDINTFYDNMEQVEIASTAVKELPIKERRRYMQEHPEFLLKKYANTFRKQMSNLRKLKYAAEDRGDERAALRIEERMKRLAMQFNKRFNEVTD